MATSSVIWRLWYQRRERLVKCLHSEFILPGLHHRIDLVDLVFADQVADSGVWHQYFESHYAAVARCLRQQGLAENAFEHQRKLRPDLGLLSGRENVDDTVDRRIGRIRVKRCKGQMAGFCDSQGHLDRFEVTHFADQHDVRILAKCGSESGAERMCVGGDLTLIDDTILVIVEKFDRVLDRQNMIVAVDVDLVDHRRKRRRFTGTGRAGHEDQAAGLFAHVRNHRRQAESVERL